jgi:hypothetical protein
MVWQGIQDAVAYLTSINNMFQYNTIHKVIGEGNFVLTVSEGTWNGTTMHFMIYLEWKMAKPLSIGT